MTIALNENRERVFVDDSRVGSTYYCQVCGKPVFAKKGNIRHHHFAHFSGSECKAKTVYGPNSMTEWHRRMQGYFPVDMREVRFEDKENNEVHIADVYIPETRTVIEFQHSQIRTEEFVARTKFHISNDRRIAWIFDESIEGATDESKIVRTEENPFWYSWKKPRRCLEAYVNPSTDLQRYGVFFYTGTDKEDIVRRILGFNKLDDVCVAPDHWVMASGMSGNELFGVGITFLELRALVKSTNAGRLQPVSVQNTIQRGYTPFRGPKEQILHSSNQNKKSYRSKKSKRLGH